MNPADAIVVGVALKAGLDATGALLGRICLPVAEELGESFRERMTNWRKRNAEAWAIQTEEKMRQNEMAATLHAHPKIAHVIVEEASWTDDAVVQDLWAGLMASSCTESGDDDSNLIFTNLLGQLTKLQARILKSACETAVKERSPSGLIHADRLILPVADVHRIAGDADIQRLDRELDHLRALDLITADSGLDFSDAVVGLTPTPLALHMFVRCQGSRKSPVEFFGLE